MGVRSFVTRALAAKLCYGITFQLRQTQLDWQKDAEYELVEPDEDVEELRKKLIDMLEVAANKFEGVKDKVSDFVTRGDSIRQRLPRLQAEQDKSIFHMARYVRVNGQSDLDGAGVNTEAPRKEVLTIALMTNIQQKLLQGSAARCSSMQSSAVTDVYSAVRYSAVMAAVRVLCNTIYSDI